MLVAIILGLTFFAVPAQAASHSTPTGCTTSVEWVQEGNHYYFGRGKVQCDTGRYKIKIQCRNLQTGVGYVVYGTQAVNAPNTAVTTCYTGNTAEKVYAVQDPPATGLTGCASWMEWVHEGSHHYFGEGNVQCDTGRYKIKIQCRNLQTGQEYAMYGSQTVYAPNTATAYCYSGNSALSVSAVPQ